MAVPSLTFDIQEPGKTPRRATTNGSVLKIGRDPRMVLGLDDGTVGRMHAVIEVTEAGKAIIVDLGCEPKTAVNGTPVNKADLQAGDQIQIGQSVLSLLAIGAFDGSAVAPPAQTPPAFAAVGNAAPVPQAGPWRWDDAPPKREQRPSWALVFVLVFALLGLALYTLLR